MYCHDDMRQQNHLPGNMPVTSRQTVLWITTSGRLRKWSRLFNRPRGHCNWCPPTAAKSGELRNLSGPASQPTLGLTDLELTVLQAAGQHSQLVPCRTGLGVPQVMPGVLEPRARQPELVGREGHCLQHAASSGKIITRGVIQLVLLEQSPQALVHGLGNLCDGRVGSGNVVTHGGTRRVYGPGNTSESQLALSLALGTWTGN